MIHSCDTILCIEPSEAVDPPPPISPELSSKKRPFLVLGVLLILVSAAFAAWKFSLRLHSLSATFTPNSAFESGLASISDIIDDTVGAIKETPVTGGATTDSCTPSTKLKINDQVQVHRGRESFEVHVAPNGAVLGKQPNLTIGTAIEGPVSAGGMVWWKIRFDTGPKGAGSTGSSPTPFNPALHGWVDDEFVVKYTSPLPSERPQSIAIKPGREFALDSYVHKPLPDNAPLDPKSAIWVKSLIRQMNDPNYYGTVAVNTHEHTPAIYIVGSDQPTVRVKVIWPKEQEPVQPDWHKVIQKDFEAVPLPADFSPAGGDDLEAVVYRPSRGKYWEFIGLRKTGCHVRNSAGAEVDEWGTYWGGRVDNLAVNPGYYEQRLDGALAGRQATGLPDLAGILTIEEQRAGIVNHALHLV